MSDKAADLASVKRHPSDTKIIRDGAVIQRPAFTFEVVAKVETLKMDGTTQFVLQGKLGLRDSDSEPQMFAMAVPDVFWRDTDCGDVWSFPLDA